LCAPSLWIRKRREGFFVLFSKSEVFFCFVFCCCSARNQPPSTPRRALRGDPFRSPFMRLLTRPHRSKMGFYLFCFFPAFRWRGRVLKGEKEWKMKKRCEKSKQGGWKAWRVRTKALTAPPLGHGRNKLFWRVREVEFFSNGGRRRIRKKRGEFFFLSVCFSAFKVKKKPKTPTHQTARSSRRLRICP
jgi:hypothetical protein